MTAGRGIIHEEYHSKEFTREGGMFEVSCRLGGVFKTGELTSNSNLTLFVVIVLSAVGELAQKAQNGQAQLPTDHKGTNPRSAGAPRRGR